ncbi:MAG: mechanosensitive ion channel [Desulfobacteraceae bacterium]|jgi:miniconductance mechanosensitive channel
MEQPIYLQWLSVLGIEAIPSGFWTRFFVAFIVTSISIIAWLISHRLAHRLLPNLIAHTKNDWDDVFMEKNLFRNLALLVPGLILYGTIPWVFYGYPQAGEVMQNFISIYLILALALCMDAFLNSVLKIYHNYPISKDIPLIRFTQILKVGLYGCAFLVVLAIVLNKSYFYFFNNVDPMNAVTKPQSGLTRFVCAMMIIFISFVAWYICRHLAHHVMPKFVTHTKNQWDDVLMRNNLFRNLALLVPGVIVNAAIPTVFNGDAQSAAIAQNAVAIYLIFSSVLCVDALLNALLEIYRMFPLSQEIPLTGFVQVLKIVLYGCALLLVMALILNRSPFYLFSGLGAMTAILMLVFKDPILGFVAGIQLITNKMLKQGDWIEMPKYGADGDVVDITLTTVKVRNFDKTITTIPTYALISDSFKNWRGMKESGGRRIKRAIYIDMSSICFCDQEMLDRFERNNYLSEYIKNKKQEIIEHNEKLEKSPETLLPLRRLTNIGTFRAYVKAYLQHHPMIRQDMTFLVRQLAPTSNGLPIEVYVFCSDNTWTVYEEVQADIFDHLLAVAPEFDLRVYQLPSGADVKVSEKVFSAKNIAGIADV